MLSNPPIPNNPLSRQPPTSIPTPIPTAPTLQPSPSLTPNDSQPPSRTLYPIIFNPIPNPLTAQSARAAAHSAIGDCALGSRRFASEHCAAIGDCALGSRRLAQTPFGMWPFALVGHGIVAKWPWHTALSPLMVYGLWFGAHGIWHWALGRRLSIGFLAL